MKFHTNCVCKVPRLHFQRRDKDTPVAIVLPLLIHMEECEVVALWDEELFSCSIALLCAVIWSTLGIQAGTGVGTYE